MSVLQAERDLFEKINEYREQKDLTTFKYDDFMCTLARYHSQNMAEKKIPFGHENATNRLNMIKTHYSKLNFHGGAENVYCSFNTEDFGNALESWQWSDGHNKNLLGLYNRIGIGCAVNEKNHNHYTTAIFAQLK